MSEEVVAETAPIEEEKSFEEIKEELTKEEIELGKKHGVIEEEKKQEEKKEEEKVVVPVVMDDKAKLQEKIKNNEELTVEEEKKVHEWGTDEKAMYWRWKGEKQKRQTIAKEKELAEVKVSASRKRIEELEETIKKLKDGEVEEEFINREEAIAKAKLELEKQNAPKIDEQAEAEYKKSLLEELSYNEKARNPQYEEIEKEFIKIVNNNQKIRNMVLDKVAKYDGDRLAGKDLINFAYAVVEDSGYKVQPKADKKQEEKTKRIIENSAKPTPIDAIATGSKHAKTFEEYEAIDVLNMSDAEYRKLSDKQRADLLKKFG